jgi:hypothetical protein
MRIDSSGNVLVNKTSARNNFYNTTTGAVLQIEGSGSTRRVGVIGNDAGGTIVLANSPTYQGNTLVSDQNVVGVITFQGNDGTDFVELASISGMVNGSPGADDMPGALLFSTTADGSASSTERMRIDSSGNVAIGATTAAARLVSAGSSVTNFKALILRNGDGATNSSASIDFEASTGTQGAESAMAGRIAGVRTGAGTSGALTFSTTNGGTLGERARITSGGYLLVNKTTGSGNIIAIPTGTQGDVILSLPDDGTNQGSAYFFNCINGGENAAGCAITVKTNNATSRSINAGGTINASGNDYAEYMVKAGDFAIDKGDVCGVNADGKLTNIFADAVAFVVKSTNPSYVGGDSWGSEDAVGSKPEKPTQRAAEVDEEGNETQAAETDEDFAARVAQYEIDLAEFNARLETERQKVDRIAFSGQVPVNVTGATAGQYIVPVESNDGITGVAVNEADMTLEQYIKAVGKVIAIEDDGRARIIVKVA